MEGLSYRLSVLSQYVQELQTREPMTEFLFYWENDGPVVPPEGWPQNFVPYKETRNIKMLILQYLDATGLKYAWNNDWLRIMNYKLYKL